MAIEHEVLVEGSALSFEGGFFGLSAIVLVRVPGERPILFDTGHYTTRGLLLRALATRGLGPEHIGTVFLSHLHFDHVNNVDLFPDATILLPGEEWAYAGALPAEDLFVPRTIRDQLGRHRLKLLSAPREIAPGLRWAPAPGHTPGLGVLSYTDGQGRRVTLASDALKTAREAFSGRCDMEFDPERRGAATMGAILQGSDVIVPGHHPAMTRTGEGWIWAAAPLPLIIR